MTLAIRKLHPTIGAEVENVDAATALPDVALCVLKDTLAERGVLVLRDQHLDDGAFVAFSRSFGALELLPEADKRADAHPEIFNLSNVKPDGSLYKADDPHAVFLRGTARWHTDSSYRPVPCLATLLYALEVSPEGGETEFADMYQAYETLPEAEKTALGGLKVVHSYEHSRAGNPGKLKPMTEAERAAVPPVEHPLVRTHPTGRRSLYMGAHASHIAGMDVAEGRAMLQTLTEHATQPERVYRHKWAAHDLVIWDNRCTLHQLIPYDIERYRRIMRRTTVCGTGPVV